MKAETKVSLPESEEKTSSYSRNVMIQKIIRHVICILLCVVSLFPFYITVINATRTNVAIQQGLSLIPSTNIITNIQNLFDKASALGTPIYRCFLNSAMIAVPATLFSVYFSSLTAYGVFAYNFKLRRFAWSFVLGIMMIPGQVTSVGFYQFMLKLGLNDSYLPLIIPAIAAPTTVFFMRQFMKASLPLEIIDAARIDGSGEFKTFNTIVLPLLKPAIATQAIFAFIANWNNLYMPQLILKTQTKYTLPMFVAQLKGDQFRADYGVIYAALLVTIVPMLIFYLILSKYIIAGVALGGVKE